MATTSQQGVDKLSLDLKNFRTVPQKKESAAIKAMITIKPDRFYAIMESIIQDGYIPTENIIILDDGKSLTVKEGNRRIAALKLIHGHYKISEFGLPSSIIEKIENLDATWKKENLEVPCTIFAISEADKADKVVALAHGKGEKASRDPWSSVATARHNRDAKGISEPSLDLLEKYLKNGNNLNNQQKERWAGEYPLTVLYEALRVLYPRLGFNTISDFVAKYPKIKKVSEIEDLIRDIGLELVQFKTIRDIHTDFALNYGIEPIVLPSTPLIRTKTPITPSSNTVTNSNVISNLSNAIPFTNTQSNNNSPSTNSTGTNFAEQNKSTPAAKKAYAVNDPKQVASLLKTFIPKGANRQKVVTLSDEIKKIKINETPIAFCFLLRSMFEISAKAYCSDHSISLTKPIKNGKPIQDKNLVELLKEITKHLTTNNSNKEIVKKLHGALVEIEKPTGILSVTSMNNLVHNPVFSVQPPDICTLFGNIYPLLDSMN